VTKKPGYKASGVRLQEIQDQLRETLDEKVRSKKDSTVKSEREGQGRSLVISFLEMTGKGTPAPTAPSRYRSGQSEAYPFASLGAPGPHEGLSER